MSKPFELEVIIDYNMNTPYKDILWKGEWVRGITVSFSVTITNKSEYVFPGTTFKVSLIEHSPLISSKIWTWTHGIVVPRLESEAYFTSSEYEHTPQFEGVCEVILESGILKRENITVSGSMRKTAEKNRISSQFVVVRSHELEIIQLLRKLTEKEK